MNFSQQAEKQIKNLPKTYDEIARRELLLDGLLLSRLFLWAESKMPALVLDFISLNRKKFF